MDTQAGVYLYFSHAGFHASKTHHIKMKLKLTKNPDIYSCIVLSLIAADGVEAIHPSHCLAACRKTQL